MVPKLLGVTPHRAAQDLGFYGNSYHYETYSNNLQLLFWAFPFAMARDAPNAAGPGPTAVCTCLPAAGARPVKSTSPESTVSFC